MRYEQRLTLIGLNTAIIIISNKKSWVNQDFFISIANLKILCYPYRMRRKKKVIPNVSNLINVDEVSAILNSITPAMTEIVDREVIEKIIQYIVIDDYIPEDAFVASGITLRNMAAIERRAIRGLDGQENYAELWALIQRAMAVVKKAHKKAAFLANPERRLEIVKMYDERIYRHLEAINQQAESKTIEIVEVDGQEWQDQ